MCFDHDSVNIQYFTFSLLQLVSHHLGTTNFIEEKIFSGTKWRRKFKMAAKFQ
jgi:hypothetical protein